MQLFGNVKMDFHNIFLLLAQALFVQRALGGGTVVTTLLSYTEYEPRNFNGELCDSESNLPCDRFYVIEITPEGQRSVKVETPVIMGNDFTQLPAFLVRMDRLTSVSYEIILYDRDDGNPAPLRTMSSLLGTITVNRLVVNSTVESQTLTLNTSKNYHGISLKVDVRCDQSYFGPGCDVQCSAQDNDEGHFTCDQNGDLVCRPGFTDVSSGCVTPVNSACTFSSCQNGGTCSGGRCQCRRGYTGESCEIDIDECACNPCSNGGECVEGIRPGTFSCICPAGWVGELCDEDLNECESGGQEGFCPLTVSCVNTPGSFSCCIGIPFDPSPPEEEVRTRPPLVLEPITEAPTTTPQPAAATPAPTTASTPAATTPAPTPAAQPSTVTEASATDSPTRIGTTPATPAPATAAPTPAPTTAAPTPAAQTPAPTTAAPTPAAQTPAPTTAAPTPAVQTPAPITAAPTPAAQTPAPTPQPTPALQVTPVSAVPPPVIAKTPSPVIISDSLCGNPSPQERTAILTNIALVLQRKPFQLHSINLQKVTASPLTFANFVRVRCGVNIIARVYANPVGSSQLSCLMMAIRSCAFGQPQVNPAPAPAHPPPTAAPSSGGSYLANGRFVYN